MYEVTITNLYSPHTNESYLIFRFLLIYNSDQYMLSFKKDKQKLLPTINMVQEQGLLVAQRMEWIKKIDNDIFEIRSKVSSNIQRALYFHVTDERYIITHGFTKKTQKTPVNKIKHAKALKKEFEKNNNG